MLHIINTSHYYQLKIPFKDIHRLKIYKFVNKVPGEQKRCYQGRAATVLGEESMPTGGKGHHCWDGMGTKSTVSTSSFQKTRIKEKIQK